MAAPSRFPKLRVDQLSSRVQDNIEGTLGPVSRAVGSSPLMGVAPAWIRHSLATAFATVTGLAGAAYYKDSLMRVWSKGVLTTSAGVAAGVSHPGAEVTSGDAVHAAGSPGGEASGDAAGLHAAANRLSASPRAAPRPTMCRSIEQRVARPATPCFGESFG